MYTQFFGMKEHPFSIVPDPNFLYMSERHAEALAHLNFGQGEHGGFVLLTGEVGTGKTTVSRRLIAQLPETTQLAFILNPALTEVELLATVCDELGIAYQQEELSLKVLFDGISQRLIANHQAGKHTVLLIDEAQHLSLAAMEQLRLLTNLETHSRKLLQVILIGQPELQQMLKQNNLRQLAQRITARYHLMPLNMDETRSYIEYRLQMSGVNYPIFSSQAVSAVFAASKGIPRLINLICDRALLAVYALGIKKVDVFHITKAASEVLGTEEKAKFHLASPWAWLTAASLVGLFLLILLPAGSVFEFFAGEKMPAPSKASDDLHSYMDLAAIPAKATSSTPLSPLAANPKSESVSPLLVEQSQLDTPISSQGSMQNGSQKSPESHHILDEKRPEQDSALKMKKQSKALPSLLALANEARTQPQAYVNLFKVWGIELPEHQARCQMTGRLNLRCLDIDSELERLLMTNSPAVVELQDEQGLWYAVLFEVDSKFHLLVGEHAISVSPQWFEQHWQGKATLLWQPPVDYIGQLMVGGRGRAVQWLESSLAKVSARPVRHISRFDKAMKKEVQAFQNQYGLVNDGIAGVQTLIRLRQILNATLPRLQNLVDEQVSEWPSDFIRSQEINNIQEFRG